jgi:hypothetical protein
MGSYVTTEAEVGLHEALGTVKENHCQIQQKTRPNKDTFHDLLNGSISRQFI